MALKLSKNAQTVLEKRYLMKKDGQVVETPEDLFKRVAANIAEADKLYDENADVEAKAARFYEVMTELKFLPNSPTLMVRQDS